jgi:hypothetical protein
VIRTAHENVYDDIMCVLIVHDKNQPNPMLVSIVDERMENVCAGVTRRGQSRVSNDEGLSTWHLLSCARVCMCLCEQGVIDEMWSTYICSNLSQISAQNTGTTCKKHVIVRSWRSARLCVRTRT